MSSLDKQDEEPEAKRRRLGDTSQEEGKDGSSRRDNETASYPRSPESKQEPETKRSSSAISCTTHSRVYVGNLHPRVAQVHFEKLMKPFGSVVDLTICNQSSHGFGFCEYSSSAEADKAISALNGRKLLGLTLLVQRAKGRRQDQRRGLAIGGISAQELDETKLDNKIIKLRQALDKKTYKR